MDKAQCLEEIEKLKDPIVQTMELINHDLKRSTIMTAPCRRVRLNSIKLQHYFKKFRSLSCEAGLK